MKKKKWDSIYVINIYNFLYDLSPHKVGKDE